MLNFPARPGRAGFSIERVWKDLISGLGFGFSYNTNNLRETQKRKVKREKRRVWTLSDLRKSSDTAGNQKDRIAAIYIIQYTLYN